jgi:hypothetical protein
MSFQVLTAAGTSFSKGALSRSAWPGPVERQIPGNRLPVLVILRRARSFGRTENLCLREQCRVDEGKIAVLGPMPRGNVATAAIPGRLGNLAQHISGTNRRNGLVRNPGEFRPREACGDLEVLPTLADSARKRGSLLLPVWRNPFKLTRLAHSKKLQAGQTTRPQI